MRNAILATCSVAALLTAGIAQSAKAQTMNYGSLEMMFGEPVTTSATGSPQKASDAPVPLEIITAEDIKRSGLSNIADIVSRVSGVNVQHSAAQGYDIGVRGYNEPLAGRLLVLVNGRQVYLDFFGFTDWSALPVRLEEIQQIEVVKGPNTALFGFNAAAGVINIVTFNPAYDDKSAVTARGGSNSTTEVSGAATYKFAPGSGVRLSAGYDREREYPYSDNQVGATLGNKGLRADPSANTIAGEGTFTVADGTQLIVEATSTFHDYNVMVSPTYSVGQFEIRTQSYKGELVSNTPFGLVTARLYDNETQGNYEQQIPINSSLLVAQVQDLFKAGADTTVRVSGEFRTNSMHSTPEDTGTVKYNVYSGGLMAEHKFGPAYTLTASRRRTAGRAGCRRRCAAR